MRRNDIDRRRNGTGAGGEEEQVSIDMFWSMKGACVSPHPHVSGVVCVRDEGHPGVYPGVHRFWRKTGLGGFEAVEWGVDMEAGMVRSRMASPRPSPARSNGSEKRWGK